MKSRVTAALIAFFLGGIGIHRFYLRQTGLGILYLVFFWTFIPSIIAFIDFIVLLLMSDEAFDVKYNGLYAEDRQKAPVYINNYHAGKNDNIMDTRVNSNQRYADPRQPIIPKQAEVKDPFEEDGDDKYALYDFNGAIYDYLRSLKVKAKNPGVHFKLACLYSMLEEKDNAYHHLAKAIEFGFINMSEIQTNDHLDNLRQDENFDTFVKNGFKIPNAVKLDLSERLELSDAIISQIERLAKMRDQGVINDSEFQAQKEKILNH